MNRKFKFGDKVIHKGCVLPHGADRTTQFTIVGRETTNNYYILLCEEGIKGHVLPVSDNKEYSIWMNNFTFSPKQSFWYCMDSELELVVNLPPTSKPVKEIWRVPECISVGDTLPQFIIDAFEMGYLIRDYYGVYPIRSLAPDKTWPVVAGDILVEGRYFGEIGHYTEGQYAIEFADGREIHIERFVI